MSEPAAEPRADERLRQLLAIEGRLQDLVCSAEARAARQIEAAREARERWLTEARDAAAQADAARSREERTAHEQALAVIERDHQKVVAALDGVSGEQIDALARWALDQIIGARGDAA